MKDWVGVGQERSASLGTEVRHLRLLLDSDYSWHFDFRAPAFYVIEEV